MSYIKLSEYAKLKDIPYRTAYEWFNNGKLNGKKDENGNILIESSSISADQSIMSITYFKNNVCNDFVLKNLSEITVCPPDEKMLQYQYSMDYTTQVDQILDRTTQYLKISLARAVFDCISSLKNIEKTEIQNINEVQINETKIVLCNPSFFKIVAMTTEQFNKIEENNIYCAYAFTDRYYIVMKHRNITYEQPFCIVMPSLNNIRVDIDLPKQTIDKDGRIQISHYKNIYWMPNNHKLKLYLYNEQSNKTTPLLEDCMNFLSLQEEIDFKVKQQNNKYLITNMNNETLTIRLENNEFIIEEFRNTVIKEQDTLIRIIKEWCKYTGEEVDYISSTCKNLINIKDGLEIIPHQYKPQITIVLDIFKYRAFLTQNKKIKEFVIKYDKVNDQYLLILNTKTLRFAHTLGGLECICNIINKFIYNKDLDNDIKSFMVGHPELTLIEDPSYPYQTYIINSVIKNVNNLYIRVSTTDELLEYTIFSHIIYNGKIYHAKNETVFDTEILTSLETVISDYKQFLSNIDNILEEETDEKENKEGVMTTSIIKHITSISQKAREQASRLSNQKLTDPIPVKEWDDKIHLRPNHDEETTKAIVEITKELDMLFQEIREMKEVSDLAWLIYSQFVVSQPPLVAISFFNSITEIMSQLLERLSDKALVYNHDYDPYEDIDRALQEGFNKEEIYSVPAVANMTIPLEERQKLAAAYHKKMANKE